MIDDVTLLEVDGLIYAVRLIKTASHKNVPPTLEGPRDKSGNRVYGAEHADILYRNENRGPSFFDSASSPIFKANCTWIETPNIARHVHQDNRLKETCGERSRFIYFYFRVNNDSRIAKNLETKYPRINIRVMHEYFNLQIRLLFTRVWRYWYRVSQCRYAISSTGLTASVIKRLFQLNISITRWNSNLFREPDLNLNAENLYRRQKRELLWDSIVIVIKNILSYRSTA